jgi:carboxymethylenebutenolidase
VTIDYFGRTAGRHARAEDFPYQDHVAQTTFEGVRLDVAAAVELLHEDRPDRRVFTLGFCFGGSSSWQQAANGHGLAGAIGFYGVPARENRPLGGRSAIALAPEMECPVLALIGGDDPSIPPEMIAEFDQALTKAGVEHEIQVYPDAPHSFFDRAQERFVTESADAWARVLGFIDRYS